MTPENNNNTEQATDDGCVPKFGNERTKKKIIIIGVLCAVVTLSLTTVLVVLLLLNNRTSSNTDDSVSYGLTVSSGDSELLPPVVIYVYTDKSIKKGEDLVVHLNYGTQSFISDPDSLLVYATGTLSMSYERYNRTFNLETISEKNLLLATDYVFDFEREPLAVTIPAEAFVEKEAVRDPVKCTENEGGIVFVYEVRFLYQDAPEEYSWRGSAALYYQIENDTVYLYDSYGKFKNYE